MRQFITYMNYCYGNKIKKPLYPKTEESRA